VFPQAAGKYFGVIKYSEVAGIQEASHATRVTRTGQDAGNHLYIKAGKHTEQFHSQRFHERRIMLILTLLVPA
jgi:hypothetical protein